MIKINEPVMSSTNPDLVIDYKITILEVPAKPEFRTVKERDRWDFIDCNSKALQIVQPVVDLVLMHSEDIVIANMVKPFLPIYAVRFGFS